MLEQHGHFVSVPAAGFQHVDPGHALLRKRLAVSILADLDRGAAGVQRDRDTVGERLFHRRENPLGDGFSPFRVLSAVAALVSVRAIHQHQREAKFAAKLFANLFEPGPNQVDANDRHAALAIVQHQHPGVERIVDLGVSQQIASRHISHAGTGLEQVLGSGRHRPCDKNRQQDKETKQHCDVFTGDF